MVKFLVSTGADVNRQVSNLHCTVVELRQGLPGFGARCAPPLCLVAIFDPVALQSSKLVISNSFLV